ncbi:MAG: phage protein Gp27 family protein [Panacagrimonas sp.]
MSRTSAVYELPVRLQRRLDTKLREGGYGKYIQLAQWLKEEGFDISKSTLHRHGSALKARDSLGEELKGSLSGVDHDTAKDAAALLIELGSMRVRESAILARLQELGITGWKQPGE